MRFWIRELAGWLLIALGLFIFYVCYVWLRSHNLVEAGPLSFIGFIVFRGGIHLLKVAVAARVCTETRDRVSGERPGQAAARPQRQWGRTMTARRV
jgi:hypothetical protein